MRLAGCSGFSEVMSLSASVTDAIVGSEGSVRECIVLPQVFEFARLVYLLSSGRETAVNWDATVFCTPIEVQVLDGWSCAIAGSNVGQACGSCGSVPAGARPILV